MQASKIVFFYLLCILLFVLVATLLEASRGHTLNDLPKILDRSKIIYLAEISLGRVLVPSPKIAINLPRT